MVQISDDWGRVFGRESELRRNRGQIGCEWSRGVVRVPEMNFFFRSSDTIAAVTQPNLIGPTRPSATFDSQPSPRGRRFTNAFQCILGQIKYNIYTLIFFPNCRTADIIC